jgi:hypothetical protein
VLVCRLDFKTISNTTTPNKNKQSPSIAAFFQGQILGDFCMMLGTFGTVVVTFQSQWLSELEVFVTGSRTGDGQDKKLSFPTYGVHSPDYSWEPNAFMGFIP